MFTRLQNLPLENQDSLFLFGPRGTGKTYWIKKHIEDSLYIDLLDYAMYRMLSARPETLEQLIPKGFSDWIVIDEVQKVPALLDEVHRLIEHKHYKFLLTGSSARKLRKEGVNLLAGRALTYYMHPLIIQELQDHFDLNHVLQYGLLPKTFLTENPQKYLDSYVQTYLREEVLQEGLTRDIGTFTRCLEIASFSQGATLNFSEIAREVGVSSRIVASYFEIFEDLLLSVRIPVFSKRAKRRLIKNSKFYFFDVGVYRTLRPTGILDSPEEIDGAALETLFLQSLRAVNDYLDLGYTIYFWRTSDGTEVDFVLYGKNGFHAFEIKRSSVVTPKYLSGLKSFHRDYPSAKRYLIYGGNHREYHDEIEVIPFEEALEMLPEIMRKL